MLTKLNYIRIFKPSLAKLYNIKTRNLILTSPKLFQLPEFPSILHPPNKKWEHSEKKIIGHSKKEMYDIIYNVEKYSEFVPWCKECVINHKSPKYLMVDMTVGFGPISECFESHVTTLPDFIKAVSMDGKVLSHMVMTWNILPGLPRNAQTCIIDSYVSFEFKSAFYSTLMGTIFNQLIDNTSRAFIKRAEQLYGKPSVQSKLIT